MARTIAVPGEALASRQRSQKRGAISLKGILRQAVAVFTEGQDKQIERFIRQRGGVINDALEREISRHLGRL